MQVVQKAANGVLVDAFTEPLPSPSKQTVRRWWCANEDGALDYYENPERLFQDEARRLCGIADAQGIAYTGADEPEFPTYFLAEVYPRNP